MGGYCRECFLAELEEAIAEEHPELKRGDVFELVQEWLRAVDNQLYSPAFPPPSRNPVRTRR